MASAVNNNQAFGPLLRYWRTQRNFSQLDLALASNVSQRHISFLESGRAQPSRDMVLKLASVLDIPLRQQNQMLTTVGFSPLYSEFDLDAAEMAPIRRALAFTLQQQEPFPALVIDRYWNQITTNQGAATLMRWLLGDQLAPEEVGANLMKLMLHPEGIKPQVSNWDAIAPLLIQRVYRESRAGNSDDPSQQLLQDIMAYPNVQELWQSPTSEDWQLPLLTITFDKEGQQLSFFSTLTTLGTPQDITLQELRLECFFPANDQTEVLFRTMYGAM